MDITNLKQLSEIEFDKVVNLVERDALPGTKFTIYRSSRYASALNQKTNKIHDGTTLGVRIEPLGTSRQ